MNTSSTNKRYAVLDKELEAIILEVEEEEKELNFESLDFESRDDYFDDDDDYDYYYEPTEAEEWYDFDPDC